MKVVKIRHAFVKLQRIVFTFKVSLCLQKNGKQNTTFQFSVKLIYNKMHEATFRLVLFKDNMLIAHSELLLQIIEWIVGNFLTLKSIFIKSKMP